MCRIREAELLRIKIKKQQQLPEPPLLAKDKTHLATFSPRIWHWKFLVIKPAQNLWGVSGQCYVLLGENDAILFNSCLQEGETFYLWIFKKSIFVESHTQFKLVKQKSTPCLLCDTCGQAREKGDPCVLLAGTISLTAPTEPFNLEFCKGGPHWLP